MAKNILINGNTYTGVKIVQIPLSGSSGNATFKEEGELLLQSKSITPTKDEQSVTPDSNYFGLGSVAVKAIPDAYVQPTSINAGGELSAGSTIEAGTYFTGAATVPSGGGLAEGQVAVYWPYTNGKILVSEPVVNSDSTTKGASLSFVLNGEVSGCGVFMLLSNVIGATTKICGGYGVINTNDTSKVGSTFNAVRTNGNAPTASMTTPVWNISNGITTVAIAAGSNYVWAEGTYRMIYVCANNGGIF